MATTTAPKPTKSSYTKRTKAELDELARERDIDGRSEMTKQQLVDALVTSDIGPNAVDLLISHHDRIRELFASLEGRSSRPSQAKIDDVRELISTLVKHAEVEELVFYPAIREELGLTDDVDESLEEHHAAELLMAELEKLPAEAERYDAKITVLRENVTHHLEEEENDLFPQVRAKLDEQRLRELGNAMVQAWNIAPSRPHPFSPDTPPGNWLVGIPAAGYDIVVGVLKGVKRLVFRR